MFGLTQERHIRPSVRCTYATPLIESLSTTMLMSNVLGIPTVIHHGVRKTKFFGLHHFSILVKFDYFAMLYKSLSVWAEALKA